MYCDYLVADINGPESLSCELSNDANTELSINLQSIIFGIYDFQYQSNQVNWDDILTIGGQKYYQVKNFQGVNYASNNQYIDSTFCFYNLQYGMLKFIINDTLIYQRIIH